MSDPATEAERQPFVTADRSPGNFGAFRDETLAGLQLARAAAWAVVALLARNAAAQADAPGPFEALANAAGNVAADRAIASALLAKPEDGGLPAEYAPALALRRLLTVDDPSLDTGGWIEGFPHSFSRFGPPQTCDSDLLGAIRALSALDRAPADPATARRRIETRLIAADGRAVPFDVLRRLNINLAEADFRRIVGKLRDEGFATISEADLSTYGKRRIQRFLTATNQLLFRAPGA